MYERVRMCVCVCVYLVVQLLTDGCSKCSLFRTGKLRLCIIYSTLYSERWHKRSYPDDEQEYNKNIDRGYDLKQSRKFLAK